MGGSWFVWSNGAQRLFGLLLAQVPPLCKDGFRCPDLWFGRLEALALFAGGNLGFRQFEGLLQVVSLVQGLAQKGAAEVGEVGVFRAAKRHPIGTRGADH